MFTLETVIKFYCFCKQTLFSLFLICLNSCFEFLPIDSAENHNKRGQTQDQHSQPEDEMTIKTCLGKGFFIELSAQIGPPKWKIAYIHYEMSNNSRN